MSFFVIVTFDLHGAKAPKYLRVKNEMAEIDFSKYVVGRKDTPTRLPHNTYAAEFDNDNFDKSSELTEYVAGEVRRIFKDTAVIGEFFVTTGRGWAWRCGSVRKLGKLVRFSRLAPR